MKGGVTTKNRCDKESKEIRAALKWDWMRGWDAISRLNRSVGWDKGGAKQRGVGNDDDDYWSWKNSKRLQAILEK